MITQEQRIYFIDEMIYFIDEMRICANLLVTSNPTERLRLLAKIQHYTNILLADAVEEE